MNSFKISVNIEEVTSKLNQTQEAIENVLKPAIESVSIATHAFILNKANTELSGFKREMFLGLGQYAKKASGQSSKDERVDSTAKNVRWIKISNNMWVVEIDESAKWIEEGRPETSMATDQWLLKPGKAKIAKDGSTYRSIPFKQTEGKKDAPGAKPLFAELVKRAAKRQNVSLTKPEIGLDGKPKIGIVAKLDISPTMTRSESPVLYSKPRTLEEAMATGLQPHGGIFKLKGAVVTQKLNKKGKPVKETVVFRTVSSKHKNESRWMYPQVQAFNAIPAAHKWAEEQINAIIKQIEQDFART
jgi:hypothetical protein